jgi:hypothetical protein
MSDPDLDLSIPSLMKACKGNVAMLPSFMVHDDNVWPRSGVVRTDSQGRIICADPRLTAPLRDSCQFVKAYGTGSTVRNFIWT